LAPEDQEEKALEVQPETDLRGVILLLRTHQVLMLAWVVVMVLHTVRQEELTTQGQGDRAAAAAPEIL
jgi:hypothetical protein